MGSSLILTLALSLTLQSHPWDMLGDATPAITPIPLTNWSALPDAAEPSHLSHAVDPTVTPDSAGTSLPRALYFGADWCGHCQQMKSEIFPKLRSAGWKITPTGGHIQTIDADARPDLIQRHNVTQLPTLILLREGLETRRLIGYQDQWAIGRLFE